MGIYPFQDNYPLVVRSVYIVTLAIHVSSPRQRKIPFIARRTRILAFALKSPFSSLLDYLQARLNLLSPDENRMCVCIMRVYVLYDELAVMQRRLTRVARNSPTILEAFDEGDAG